MSESKSRKKLELGDFRHLEKQFLYEFIEMYKSLPCLWQVKNKQYSDRALKDKAYQVLIKKYREVDKRADRDTIVRKINSLRSCYRKELKRIDTAAKKGDNYKTQLWYFKNLSFLRELQGEVDESGESTMRDISQDFLDRSMSPVQSLSTSVSEAAESESNMTNTRQTHTPYMSTSRTSTKYKRNSDDPIQNVMYLIGNRLNSTRANDHLDYAVKNWLATLRSVSREQEIYAVRLIGDVMCEAQLGSLSRESRLECAPSQSQLELNRLQHIFSEVPKESINSFSIKQLPTPLMSTTTDSKPLKSEESP